MEQVDGIEELMDRYELFLFDQFGVLHDGHVSYDGMHATLTRLKEAGKATGVITNSGNREQYTRERLARFGYEAELFDLVVSSGEVAWCQLNGQGSSELPALDQDTPERVLRVSRGNDSSAVEGLSIVETDNPEMAGLVLIAGCNSEAMSLQAYNRWLAPAARRGVPALCTNPDRTLLIGNGRKAFGPGQIAEAYAANGGPVSYVGKPWPAIYAFACERLGIDRATTLCIGDSLEHDIAGAQAAGCASMLVATGIHESLGTKALTEMSNVQGMHPDWMIRRAG